MPREVLLKPSQCGAPLIRNSRPSGSPAGRRFQLCCTLGVRPLGIRSGARGAFARDSTPTKGPVLPRPDIKSRDAHVGGVKTQHFPNRFYIDFDF